MRLHAMLNLPGGNPQQGREISFKLRYRGPGGVPYVREVAALMLPLSDVEELAARRAAQAVAQGTPGQDGAEPVPPQLSEGGEYVVQFLARCLRDPGNPAELLCSEPRDMQALRDGLVGPQYRALLEEYRDMMLTEYPDPVTKADVADMEAEARDFSGGDQPARG